MKHAFQMKAFWIPLCLLIVFIPFSAAIDLEVSRWFYLKTGFASNRFLDAVYFYGLFPTWITLAGATLLFAASFFSSRFSSLRKPCLYLMLTLAIGNGLLIHLVFKENWGRPRPKQTIEFGGNQTFLPFYEPNFHPSSPAKSFSSGHSSFGFYFFTLMLLGKQYRKRWLFWLGLLLTIVLGGLLSYTRIAQGGHFFSDVLISALIMWWTAYFLIVFLEIRAR